MSNKMKDLETIVYTAVGEASMCWQETPKGVFDERFANDVAKRLCDNIRSMYEKL